jgi:exosortase
MKELLASPLARLAFVVALAAAVVLLCFDSFSSMVALWPLSAYQHAYLVVPVVLYLLWLERNELAARPLRGSLVGLAAFAAVLMAWIVGRTTAVQAVEHLAAAALVPALALTVLGWPAFRTVAFPLLFLMAVVPVGEELIPLLLAATADVS